MDLAINKNGNFIINAQSGLLGVVTGNSEVKQIIYLAMMEAPADLIIGSKYTNSDDISEVIKNYLDAKIGNFLPFSFDMVTVIVNRSITENISIKISMPNIANDNTESINVLLQFKGREGYYEQLDYSFQPNLGGFPGRENQIVELFSTKESTNKFILNYEYSGVGPILILPIDMELEKNNSIITIDLEPLQKKYNILEYLDGDILADKVSILSGEELLDKKINTTTGLSQIVSIEHGTPYIYTKGTSGIVKAMISYSNGLSYANSTISIDNGIDLYVFPLKLTRYKYLAIGDISVDPGEYKIIYNAILRYNGALR